MGQYFVPLNFTKGEKIERDGHWGKLEELYLNYGPNEFVQLLAMHVWVDPPSYTGNDPSNMGELNIATELLELIFKNINTFPDAICFAVAHPRLMAIGEKRLRTLYNPYVTPPWLNNRLVILGDYAKVPDFPETISRHFSSDATRCRSLMHEFRNRFKEVECGKTREEMLVELKERMTRKAEVRQVEADEDEKQEKPPKKTRRKKGTSWTRKKATKKQATAQEEGKGSKVQKKKVIWKALEPEGPNNDWERAQGFMARATFPQGKTDHWVLCNLSKGLYVQREYLAKRSGVQERKGGYLCNGRFGLGSVLLMTTLCGQRLRRQWAGDRFAIMLMTELEKRIKAKGVRWRDVSKEIHEELKNSGIGGREPLRGYDSEEDESDTLFDHDCDSDDSDYYY